VENKSNTAQAFWVGLGSFSKFALGLVSAAILSRYFDKTEYGTYRQVLYVYNTLLVIFTAGLPRVFSYFLPRFTLAQGKEIVWKVTKILLFFGFIFSVILFVCSGLISRALNNPELAVGLKYFSPIPLLLLPTLGIEGIFSSYRKTTYIAIYNVSTRLLMLACIVLPVILLKGTYLHAIYGWIVVSFITLIIAYYFKGIPFRGVSTEASNLSLKEIFNYSLPLVSASVATMAIVGANQFYISRYYGTEVFAEFSNGFIEIPFVTMLTGASATVLMPLFSKIVHEKTELNRITTLWNSNMNKSAILIYPMVFFFMSFAKEFVTIIFSDAYLESAKYFSTAMVMNFFNIVMFAPLLFALGEVKFYARMHYAQAVATWLFAYLAMLVFDSPLAIAISYVSIFIIGIWVSIWYSAKKIGVTFFVMFPVPRLLIISLHSVLSIMLVKLALRYILPDLEGILLLAVAGTIYLLLLLASARIFKIKYWDIVLPLLNRKNPTNPGIPKQ